MASKTQQVLLGNIVQTFRLLTEIQDTWLQTMTWQIDMNCKKSSFIITKGQVSEHQIDNISATTKLKKPANKYDY